MRALIHLRAANLWAKASVLQGPVHDVPAHLTTSRDHATETWKRHVCRSDQSTFRGRSWEEAIAHGFRGGVEATVEGYSDQLKPDGFQPYLRRGGAWARVHIGHVIATFRADFIGITTPVHFSVTGIDPTDHRIYVVKLGYLHPQLEDVRGRHILLLSDGASNLDVTKLSWSRIPRPAYPVDADATWSAGPNTYTTPA